MPRPGELHRAMMYCLDADGRIRSAQHLLYTTDEDMRRQAEAELCHSAKVEVWTGAVCVLRLPGEASADG